MKSSNTFESVKPIMKEQYGKKEKFGKIKAKLKGCKGGKECSCGCSKK